MVVKLSDNILVVNPNPSDIVKLLPKSENGYGYGIASDQFLSIVDKQNEKIYKWPKEIDINGIKSEIDSKGNIYLHDNYNGQIYKLNVSDFTVQQMLPNSQDHITDFKVTDDGFIVYWNENQCRVRCPGGRTYPVSDNNAFILNGNLYSIREGENAIIRYKTVGNNDIEEETVSLLSRKSG